MNHFSNKMDEYYLLSSDEMELSIFKDSANVDIPQRGTFDKDKSATNKSAAFLERIKKNRSDAIKANRIYCEKKAQKLFAVDLFFDLKLLQRSVDFVMKMIEESSSKLSLGNISLEILGNSKAPYIQELHKIQTEISNDPKLSTKRFFLNQWADYVFKSFTTLTEAISEATSIPIRPNTFSITSENEEGMFLYLKDGKYFISIWWQRSPTLAPCRSDLYCFYQ